MGAEQSKQALRVNESLYDILRVATDAQPEEIKQAYRRQALLLHPDRNRDSQAEATIKFAKVQSAYEVLSDPQERAWYDQQSREAPYTVYCENRTSAKDILSYLQSDHTKEMDPTRDFFYQQVSKLFGQLRNEELEAAFTKDVNPSDIALKKAPAFGQLNSSVAEVKEFYSIWSGFTTYKDFEWEDIYPVSTIQDPRVEKKLGLQNRRIRDAAIREYNDVVRRLVYTVKAMDVRLKSQRAAAKRFKESNQTSTFQGQQRAQQSARTHKADSSSGELLEENALSGGNGQRTQTEVHNHLKTLEIERLCKNKSLTGPKKQPGKVKCRRAKKFGQLERISS